MKLKNGIITAIATLIGAYSAYAQMSVKTNVLSDALLTPNVGVEIGAGSRSTINLLYALNPWTFSSDDGPRKMKHWMLMPEYRWWLCTKFDGHFIGVHLMGGQYNAENVHFPFPGAFFSGDNMAKGLRDHRYEGWFAGAGFSYGYQWVLAKHWNLEAEIGLGYDYVKYKKFKCADCPGKVAEGHTNYFGVSQLALSIIYLF